MRAGLELEIAAMEALMGAVAPFAALDTIAARTRVIAWFENAVEHYDKSPQQLTQTAIDVEYEIIDLTGCGSKAKRPKPAPAKTGKRSGFVELPPVNKLSFKDRMLAIRKFVAKRPKTGVSPKEIKQSLGLTTKQVKWALSQMIDKNWLSRKSRGSYILGTLDPNLEERW